MTNGRWAQLHNYVRRHIEQKRASTKLKKIIDTLIWPASLFGILITLPQVWKIWILHETTGVSVISWSGYILTAIIWTTYGFVYNLRPVIITNSIWILLNSLIVFGTLIY